MMRAATDQAMYRSLSQGANPFRDRKKQAEGGLAPVQAGMASPNGQQRGGFIPPEQAPTPPTADLAAYRQQGQGAGQDMNWMDQPGALTHTQTPSAPTPKSYGDPYAYLGGAQTRGGSGGQTGQAIGSLAGGIAGSFLPGVGNAIGGMLGSAAGGMLGGAFNRQAASAPTDFSVSDATNALRGAYQTYLGREGSDAEIQTHLANQGLKPGGQWVGQQGMAGVLNNIQTSPEALSYQQQALQKSLQTQPQTQPQPDVATPVMPQPTSTGTKGGFRDQLQGFSATKLDDPNHNTPKYVFAKLAQNFDVKDPAQRQQLLEALKADPSGYFKDASLTGTNGDKLVIGGIPHKDFGGISTFDVIKNAAGGGEGWQWGTGEAGSAAPDMMGDSSLPSPFTAGLSSGLRGTVNLQDPNYANQLMQYLMQQLALGGALR